MDESKPIINVDDAKKLFGEKLEAQNTVPQYKVPPHVEVSDKHSPSTSSPKLNWKNILFWLGVIVVAFAAGFLIVNGPAFFKSVSYALLGNKNTSLNSALSPQSQVSDSANKTANENIPDNRLVIPKINVDAPVVWNVDPAQITQELKNGVAQYKGSALPTDANGNVFITGHSSNYWWIKSDYNQVFALLPKLEAGDKIALTYQKSKYVYEVYDKFTVKPSQVEVLNSSTDQSTLTLMTCVPIGTNLNRLIIKAKLLYTDQPITAPAETPTTTPSQNTTTPSSGGQTQPNVVSPNTNNPSTNTNSPQTQPSNQLYLPTP